MRTVIDRVRQLIGRQLLMSSFSDMAVATGISEKKLRLMRDGALPRIRDTDLLRLARTFDVNMGYLADGECRPPYASVLSPMEELAAIKDSFSLVSHGDLPDGVDEKVSRLRDRLEEVLRDSVLSYPMLAMKIGVMPEELNGFLLGDVEAAQLRINERVFKDVLSLDWSEFDYW